MADKKPTSKKELSPELQEGLDLLQLDRELTADERRKVRLVKSKVAESTEEGAALRNRLASFKDFKLDPYFAEAEDGQSKYLPPKEPIFAGSDEELQQKYSPDRPTAGSLKEKMKENLKAKVGENVEASIDAREASKYTEPKIIPGSPYKRSLVGKNVDESITAREASKFPDFDAPKFGAAPDVPKELQAATIADRKKLSNISGLVTQATLDDVVEQTKRLPLEAIEKAELSEAAKSALKKIKQVGGSRGAAIAALGGLTAAGIASIANWTSDVKKAQAVPPTPTAPSETPAGPQAKPEEQKQPKAAAPQGEEAQPKATGYKPADYTKFKQSVPKLEKMSGQLAPEERKVYEGKIDEIRQRLDNAERLYAENKQTTEYAQMAETIGQALTQLAAGWYGMKTGYDLSGIKFNKVDWEKKLDRLYNEFDTKYTRDLKNFERAQGEYEGAQSSRAKLAADYNKELEQQASKVKEKNLDLDVKTEKAAEEARRFKAEQDARTLRDQMDSKPTSKEDRKLYQLWQDKRKEYESAKKELGKPSDKPSARVKTLREFLKKRGMSDKDIDKAAASENRWDVFGAADDVPGLSTAANTFLDKIKQEMEDAKESYASSSTAPTPAKSADKQEKQNTERRVRVRKPNGEEGTIPESHLEEAKAAGYVEVQ